MTFEKEKIKRMIDKAVEANNANSTIAFSSIAIAMLLYNQELKK